MLAVYVSAHVFSGGKRQGESNGSIETQKCYIKLDKCVSSLPWLCNLIVYVFLAGKKI